MSYLSISGGTVTNNGARRRQTRSNEEAFLRLLRETSETVRDVGDDIIEEMLPEERAVLDFPIPLKKARRVLELYLARAPLGSIAGRASLTMEDVQKVLRITTQPCVNHGPRPIGDVTLITDDYALCRACRRRLDV